jgi:hypothetical protein
MVILIDTDTPQNSYVKHSTEKREDFVFAVQLFGDMITQAKAVEELSQAKKIPYNS